MACFTPIIEHTFPLMPFTSHRRAPWAVFGALLAAAAISACRSASYPRDDASLADTLGTIIQRAYTVQPGESDSAVERQLIGLYADTGSVVSASAGRMTTSRDSVAAELTWFWSHIGRNMRNPKFEWVNRRARRFSDDAALFTGEYSIAHHTPSGRPHVIGGAWSALFERRADRWQITAEHLSDLPVQAEDSASAEMYTP